jgi:hypothetical protein
MKTTLFSAVKDFINSVGEGNEFTTEQLINDVKPHVNITRWNQSNGNPYYRVHSYKTMIKKAGLINRVKQGVYVVVKRIPAEVTLTDFQYAAGWSQTHRMDKNGNWYSTDIKKDPFDFAAYLRGEYEAPSPIPVTDRTEEEPVFGNQFTQDASPSVKKSAYHDALRFIATETAKEEVESDSFDAVGNEMWNEVVEEITKDMKVGATVYIVDRHDEPDGSKYFSIVKDSIKSIVTEESKNKTEVSYITESGEEINEVDLPAVFTDKKEMLAYVEMIS